MVPSGCAPRLKWSPQTVAFTSRDHPRTTDLVGVLPLVCSPIICGSTVFRTLIDGEAGINILSVKAFDKLVISRDRLRATMPFSGVTDGVTVPIAEVELPFMFDIPGSYHTEHIDFDVTHLNLSYNAILGYLALSRFMAATHHAYNVLKMPGAGGDIITILCDEGDVGRTLECAFKTAAFALHADGEDTQMLGSSQDREEPAPDSTLHEVYPPAFVPTLTEELLVSPPGKRKAKLTAERTATKKVTLGSDDSHLTIIISANLPDK
ncbi:hypothetical protein QYE76_048015 [Lolium multiflorum]|uniref:Uncharacterized protein n=1 Tax=Lolium multiflorum TaxID=4521 RepID=A0AAD8WZU4_LOLMU|nr:hypothetical protein QYE76_048015 [Lolium multiflorum]